MPLAFARRCADRLVERIAPICEHIQIAGSIRRSRPMVGDVDLVVLPKFHLEHDLFGNAGVAVNLTAREIRAWAQAEGWSILRDGPDFLEWSAKGVQVDLWWAAPATFGTLLMCRTGSKDHNIWLAMQALDQGGKWHPHAGLYLPGRAMIGRTEEEIYAALRLPFIHPHERESDRLRLIRPAKLP